MSQKVALIIMDGWGHGLLPERSAIAAAHTPFVDSLYKKFPHTELLTHGEDVGLPAGQMGNSEVGHLNIGAGRIVYQELQRINLSIRNGELANNKTLLETFTYCRAHKKPLHLMGLVSDGGVHSHWQHLTAICLLAKKNGLSHEQIFVHAFTDGRDTDPKSGKQFLKTVNDILLENKCGRIATITGRYYAMDRDNRWERIAVAYQALVHNKGTHITDIQLAIQQHYDAGVTDEFIMPLICCDEKNIPLANINPHDAVLCFNFRTDRCREITKVLTQEKFPEQNMIPLPLHYITMTIYDHSFKQVGNLFDNNDLTMTLGEVLAKHNKTQLRAAETEKYPHVTFFFNGGRERVFEGEMRIMAASPKVATYDLQPEMSAPELTEKVIAHISEKLPDFVCLNFANPDMVGHTGVFKAVVKACETVDACVEKVVNSCLAYNYSVLLTADHGNADYMINDDGTPNTAHSTNLVPLFFIDKNYRPTLRKGRLADIAPTILKRMELPQPSEMNGVALY